MLPQPINGTEEYLKAVHDRLGVIAERLEPLATICDRLGQVLERMPVPEPKPFPPAEAFRDPGGQILPGPRALGVTNEPQVVELREPRPAPEPAALAKRSAKKSTPKE